MACLLAFRSHGCALPPLSLSAVEATFRNYESGRGRILAWAGAVLGGVLALHSSRK